jgi:hypothetical protein
MTKVHDKNDISKEEQTLINYIKNGGEVYCYLSGVDREDFNNSQLKGNT